MNELRLENQIKNMIDDLRYWAIILEDIPGAARVAERMRAKAEQAKIMLDNMK